MPDFGGFDSPQTNPLMGIVSAPPRAEPKPQVTMKEQGTVESREQDLLEKQAAEYALAEKAGRTKFATGDPERDLFLYKRFRGVIDALGELIE